ncbi:MAG: type II toxin-antitoxin system Phd/YefM family antitoxin [Planctomycetota bacterium]
MKRVGTFEAKTHLSQLLDEVRRTGQRIIIQRRGEDIAALVPCQEVLQPDREQEAREVVEFFRALRAQQEPLGAGETIEDYIEEGRKR